MFFRGDVVGALAVLSPPDAAPRSGDTEDVLASLAGNAAIAMENARLYEHEREAVRRLRQLDAMKTDFLSTVQHEMRTPLTAILGLSDLIDMCWDTWEDSPKLDALRDIQVAAKNLDGIVETIIDFSLVDGQALSLALQRVLLAPAVRAAIEAIGERHKGGLPIPAVVDVPADVAVLADPDRLGQVLRALVDNAVKFSDGRGSVTVRGHPAENGAVQDRRDRSRDRDPCGRRRPYLRALLSGRQHRDTAFRRNGMGLALVKRVVDAHGATVEVEAVAGGGTCFVLLWPQPEDGSCGAVRSRRFHLRCRYNDLGRARRGVSGALYPQSAIAGLNSPPRGRVVGSAPDAPALTTGSRAARAREPRQVRKETAVNGSSGVPWGNLV